MAITYDGTRIVCDSSADGTIQPQLLYDLSVANGWGVVDKFGIYTYIFYCPLYITGTANLYIGTSRPVETLTFIYSESPHVYALQFDSSGLCYIGSEIARRVAYINTIDLPTTNRRVIIDGRPNAGTIRVANTMFNNVQYLYVYGNATNPASIVNTVSQTIQFGLVVNEYTNIIDSSIVGGYYGLTTTATGIIDGLLIKNTNVGILLQPPSGLFTLKNIKIKELTTDNYTYLRCCNTASKTLNFIDCQIPKDKLNFYKSGVYNPLNRNTQNLQTTALINVSDEIGDLENSSVEIYNSVGDLIFAGNTDIEGKIDTVLTYFERWQTYENQILIEDDFIDYEPFKIQVSKEGYEIYELEGITVVEGEKTIIRAQLKKQIPLIIPVNGGSPILKLNPENTGEDRDLGITLNN